MAFCISTNQFPVLRTFKSCEAHYHNTRTIRGYDKESHGVPIRRDRKNHKYQCVVKRRVPNAGQPTDQPDYAYACRLYCTDVVTFKPNKQVIVDVAWGSASTNAFANATMPNSVVVLTVRGKPCICDRDGSYYAGRDKIALTPTEDGCYIVDRHNPEYPLTPMAVRRVNRKKSGPVRKRLKPFMEYVATMAAATASGLTYEAVRAMRESSSVTARTLEDFENPENWPAIVVEYMVSRYNYQARETRWVINEGKLAKRVRERLYEAEKVYYYESLPVGETHPEMMMQLL